MSTLLYLWVLSAGSGEVIASRCLNIYSASCLLLYKIKMYPAQSFTFMARLQQPRSVTFISFITFKRRILPSWYLTVCSPAVNKCVVFLCATPWIWIQHELYFHKQMLTLKSRFFIMWNLWSSSSYALILCFILCHRSDSFITICWTIWSKNCSKTY